MAAVRVVLDNDGIAKEKLAEIRADLDTLNAQASSPKPRPGIVMEWLRSLRNVLEEATGNVLGSEAILKIGAFLDAMPR